MGPLLFVDHYWILFKQHWRPLFALVVVIPAIVGILSAAKLVISPEYTSVARVTMLPSEDELRFSSSFFGGTRKNQANALSNTHKEYLRSWPVVERAMDSITSDVEERPPEPELQTMLRKAFDLVRHVRRQFDALFRLVNSGITEPPDTRIARIAKFQKAIDIDAVEGSFILQIKATLSDPHLSAAFANSLANAYVERASEQAADAAKVLEARLAKQIRQKQEHLETLAEREFAWRKSSGALSLEEKRLSLRNALDSERTILTEDKVEGEQLKVRLSIFKQQQAASEDRETRDALRREINLINARIRELDRRISVRSIMIDDLVTNLDNINAQEEPLMDLRRMRASLEDEIHELRQPVAALELAGSRELSQLRIISPAQPAPYPSSPKVLANVAKGLFAAVFAAFASLLMLDIVSRKIRTPVDILRVTGEQPLGFLPRPLIRSVVHGRRRLRQRDLRGIRSLGSTLELRLSALGYFEVPVIQVTGLGPQQFVSSATLVMAAALASMGKTVSCRLAGLTDAQRSALGEWSHRISVFGPHEEILAAHEIHIECLKPISADFDWHASVLPAPGLVCVVPSGHLTEGSIGMFKKASLGTCKRPLAFLLAESVK